VIELAEPGLNFVVKQLDRLTIDVAGMRDEMRVQSAIIMRLDGIVARSEGLQTALLEEMRAIHGQIARMNNRIRERSHSQA
jgi:hypothetical protein